jgi:transcriptional regulator GlxA family with amidase domain
MLRRKLLLAAVATGMTAEAAAAISGCDSSLGPSKDTLSVITAEEHARTIEAMKPPKRARPVVAVLAHNDSTETTDFIVPYAVLAESGAAEVVAVAPEARRIQLTPALSVEPQMTTAAFDVQYPDGADYVIVPRLDPFDDATIVSWIQAQSQSGATIVGVCAGAKTVAAAGLLDGRNGTGHWFDIEQLQKDHPTMRWVRDRRYVADRGIVTTTGVSASLPVSLALVEAIAGRDHAEAVAEELGVDTWDESHDSDAFWLDPTSKATAMRNRALGVTDLWTIPVSDGVDEIGLAFTADAWSRSFRSKALAVAAGEDAIRMRRGLMLVPDAARAVTSDDRVVRVPALQPASALPSSLATIAEVYGEDTAAFVALQLEYAFGERPVRPATR